MAKKPRSTQTDDEAMAELEEREELAARISAAEAARAEAEARLAAANADAEVMTARISAAEAARAEAEARLAAANADAEVMTARIASLERQLEDAEAKAANGSQPGVNAAAELPQHPEEGFVRVRVAGPKKGRMRIGRRFGPETVEIDVDAGELAALKADPRLSVMEA